MAILNALSTMAQGIIAREGQTVTVYFVDDDAGDYNPATGVNTPSTPTAVATTAIFLDFALVSNGSMTYGGTLIEKEDKEVYLSSAVAFPRVPSPAGDYIVDSQGTTWRIMVVKQNNPAGNLEIMYKLLVRR